MNKLTVLPMALVLTGCTFVSLSEAGSRVAQSRAEAVESCTLVGNISSQTKDKVVIDRNTGKVKEELIVLLATEQRNWVPPTLYKTATWKPEPRPLAPIDVNKAL